MEPFGLKFITDLAHARTAARGRTHPPRVSVWPQLCCSPWPPCSLPSPSGSSAATGMHRETRSPVARNPLMLGLTRLPAARAATGLRRSFAGTDPKAIHPAEAGLALGGRRARTAAPDRPSSPAGGTRSWRSWRPGQARRRRRRSRSCCPRPAQSSPPPTNPTCGPPPPRCAPPPRAGGCGCSTRSTSLTSRRPGGGTCWPGCAPSRTRTASPGTSSSPSPTSTAATCGARPPRTCSPRCSWPPPAPTTPCTTSPAGSTSPPSPPRSNCSPTPGTPPWPPRWAARRTAPPRPATASTRPPAPPPGP